MSAQEPLSPSPLPFEAATPTGQEVRGLRAGMVVFVGIAAANAANYVFNFAAARSLGPRSYGDVAALTTLTGLIGLPLAAIQFVVARDVARLTIAQGRTAVAGYVGRALAGVAVAAAAATVLFLLLVPVLHRVLHIQSTLALAITALLTTCAFIAPVFLGAAQGLQRFGILAASIAVGPLIRIPLLAGALAAGWGVAGAMAATFAAGVVGVVIPAAFLGRRYIARPQAVRIASRSRVHSVGPVLVGVLAITALSTDDVIVAKAVFDSHTAGIYSSASLIGRVLLYLPGAIVTVLLPKVASRAALNRSTRDILEASLIVTSIFCAIGCLIYAVFGAQVVRIVFGPTYSDAQGLLWMFGLAMTGYALLNVLLTYNLGHGETRTAWLLGVGAIAQMLGYVVFHETPRELVTVSIVTAGALLVAHELLVAPVFRESVELFRRPRRPASARR